MNANPVMEAVGNYTALTKKAPTNAAARKASSYEAMTMAVQRYYKGPVGKLALETGLRPTPLMLISSGSSSAKATRQST